MSIEDDEIAHACGPHGRRMVIARAVLATTAATAARRKYGPTNNDLAEIEHRKRDIKDLRVLISECPDCKVHDPGVKRCYICGQTKPIVDMMPKISGIHNLVQSVCRSCGNAHRNHKGK